VFQHPGIAVYAPSLEERCALSNLLRQLRCRVSRCTASQCRAMIYKITGYSRLARRSPPSCDRVMSPILGVPSIHQ
jgi:hypothetical protein